MDTMRKPNCENYIHAFIQLGIDIHTHASHTMYYTRKRIVSFLKMVNNDKNKIKYKKKTFKDEILRWLY